MWAEVQCGKFSWTILLTLQLLADVTSFDILQKHARPFSQLDGNDRELAVSRMKKQIKRILNMSPENNTLDNYILSVFNVENINPTYVFLLPSGDKKTIRKLIYQKSDFLEAEFPNVTSINKFKRSLNYSLNEYSDNDSDHIAQEFRTFTKTDDNPDVDNSMSEIVEENIRTERNFIKFMNDLNKDLEEELKRKIVKHKHPIHGATFKQTTLFTPYTYVNTQTIGWHDLGLEGWIGGLRDVTGHLFEHPVMERPNIKSTYNDPFVSIQASFDPVKFLKTPAPTKSVETSSTSNIVNSSAVPQRHKNSALLLTNEIEQKLEDILNRTKNIKGRVPRWPVTNSRDAHRDEDVFIARANNPFGHSTKWRWSNETDETERKATDFARTRDGRSKRGVYNLYSMIKCSTGCDPIIYKGYGCFCGFLGSGKVLDGIDRCCKMHDYCYSSANCPMFLEYFVPYLWKCYRGRPLCAVDHGEWGGPNSCASRLCHCDLSLSKCLRRYHCPRKRNVCTTSPLRLLQNLVMVF
ncbi:uncharacterized protein LOC131683516 [Topomyia yanbarensis]|uniref:uncharacterized protein LOC131683516 n=1 Tax=Topomyia yanbarensis TaxID=2498891 RepID=UPI00273B6A35|nr:uncharacterized protein LOC131683516 [Topomyia yanbarensis]